MSIHPLKGFSLIEMSIYSALLGGILATLLLSVYPLFRAIENENAHLAREMEALFITRKIMHLVSSGITIQIPTLDATSTTLQITTPKNETHRMTFSESTLFLSMDSDTPLPLTSSRISVDSFLVFHRSPNAHTPEMLEITFVLEGATFGPIRTYLP